MPKKMLDFNAKSRIRLLAYHFSGNLPILIMSEENSYETTAEMINEFNGKKISEMQMPIIWKA
jgi:hypothetical protein